MNGLERRRYPRHEMKMAVLFFLEDKRIPATTVDISKCGMNVICEQEIPPGTKPDISIKYIDDYSIHGTVRWINKIQEGPKNLYRMGIELDSILVLSDRDNHSFNGRYKFIRNLFSGLEIKV